MNQDTVKDKVALSAKAIEKMKVGDADKIKVILEKILAYV